MNFSVGIVKYRQVQANGTMLKNSVFVPLEGNGENLLETL